MISLHNPSHTWVPHLRRSSIPPNEGPGPQLQPPCLQPRTPDPEAGLTLVELIICVGRLSANTLDRRVLATAAQLFHQPANDLLAQLCLKAATTGPQPKMHALVQRERQKPRSP